MSLIAGMNPWSTMWSQPRTTIRALVHTRPTYGIATLISIFALQSFFFYANWWSLGLRAHYVPLVLLAIVLSPLLGYIWLYFNGYILYLTGHLLHGSAPYAHLRTALAWSKIPTSISLAMWVLLLILNPDYAFIQDAAGGPSSIFINLITLILSAWSLILLLQSLRELQHFSLIRSIFNVFLAWIISTVICFVAFLIVRYVYIA